MPMGIHNPLPSSMRSECRKAGKILASFVDPRQAFGPDKIIPPQILANAKGLAVITVLKAGFIGSGRFGSGIVVARLADGTWSAPSAIATAGAGVGGQIGFELTDFVFILNDYAAVRTFSQAGTLTLGGNVSVAAGPIGRNAEAAGVASMKGVAAIFSYSKTKGLFAGVSLEGSVLVERRDANSRLYNSKVTASQLLGGAIPPPPGAEPLMRVLQSRAFSGARAYDATMYNDIPIYDDRHDNVIWEGRRGDALGEGVPRSRSGSVNDGFAYQDRSKRSSTWADETYDRSPANRYRAPSSQNGQNDFENLSSRGRSFTAGAYGSDYVYRDQKPARPTAPKPIFGQKPPPVALQKNQAIALFTFDADQDGDLGFKKGEIITILKRTDKKEDWWTGRVGDRTGIFPSNYVEVVE